MNDLDKTNIANRVAEVAKPIFFATLIIIIAYLPLFAFDRVEQKLFAPMAFTLSFALLGALATALILIPGLAFSVYRKPQKVYHNRWLGRLTDRYKSQTAKIIAAPKRLIAPVGVILVSIIGLSVLVGKTICLILTKVVSGFRYSFRLVCRSISPPKWQFHYEIS